MNSASEPFPIEVKNLTKDFSEKVVLENIFFKLKAGECLAIVGENGSGKSTLINIISDIIKASSGEIKIFGMPHNLLEAKRLRGIVFQENRFEGVFSGREILTFQGMLYGLSREERKKNIKKFLALVELTKAADKQVNTYSAGMKKRLELAKALIAKPKLLLLDEPTSNLDVKIKRKIWNYINEAKQKLSLSILLATHDLKEALELSDRIILLDKKILLELNTKELTKVKTAIVLQVAQMGDMKKLEKTADQLGWRVRKIGKNAAILLVDKEKKEAQKAIISAFKNIDVREIDLHEFGLADLFLWGGAR